jgi:hypothetical protein
MLSVRHYAGSSSNISMGGFYPEQASLASEPMECGSSAAAFPSNPRGSIPGEAQTLIFSFLHPLRFFFPTTRSGQVIEVKQRTAKQATC